MTTHHHLLLIYAIPSITIIHSSTSPSTQLHSFDSFPLWPFMLIAVLIAFPICTHYQSTHPSCSKLGRHAIPSLAGECTVVVSNWLHSDLSHCSIPSSMAQVSSVSTNYMPCSHRWGVLSIM